MSERPYQPFYKPYGMTDEEYEYEKRIAAEKLQQWEQEQNDSNLLDAQVSLPCIFGQHNWVDTGNETKIWSDNKTDSEPPEDCYTQKEQKCLLCGQIRSN